MRHHQRAVIVVLGLCCAALLTLGAAPQSSAPPAPAAASASGGASEQEVHRFMEASGAAKLMTQMLDSMIKSMSGSMHDVPPEFWTEFRKEIKVNDLIDKIVPVYQKHFTSAEMNQLIQFYESPAGKKLTQEQPAIMDESMKIGQAWGQEVGMRAAQKLQQKGYKVQ